MEILVALSRSEQAKRQPRKNGRFAETTSGKIAPSAGSNIPPNIPPDGGSNPPNNGSVTTILPNSKVLENKAYDLAEEALEDAYENGANPENLAVARRAVAVLDMIPYRDRTSDTPEEFLWKYWMEAERSPGLAPVPDDVVGWGCDCGAVHAQDEECGLGRDWNDRVDW